MCTLCVHTSSVNDWLYSSFFLYSEIIVTCISHSIFIIFIKRNIIIIMHILMYTAHQQHYSHTMEYVTIYVLHYYATILICDNIKHQPRSQTLLNSYIIHCQVK